MYGVATSSSSANRHRTSRLPTYVFGLLKTPISADGRNRIRFENRFPTSNVVPSTNCPAPRRSTPPRTPKPKSPIRVPPCVELLGGTNSCALPSLATTSPIAAMIITRIRELPPSGVSRCVHSPRERTLQSPRWPRPAAPRAATPRLPRPASRAAQSSPPCRRRARAARWAAARSTSRKTPARRPDHAAARPAPRTIPVGQYVFKEGEPGNRLFLISDGEVRISRTIPGSGEEALAVLKPGSCFGEMSIFDRSERSTDAIANTGCTLITISRSDFELLLDFNRDIAYKVLGSVVLLLSARLPVTNDNLRSFLAMSMF